MGRGWVRERVGPGRGLAWFLAAAGAGVDWFAVGGLGRGAGLHFGLFLVFAGVGVAGVRLVWLVWLEGVGVDVVCLVVVSGWWRVVIWLLGYDAVCCFLFRLVGDVGW